MKNCPTRLPRLAMSYGRSKTGQISQISSIALPSNAEAILGNRDRPTVLIGTRRILLFPRGNNAAGDIVSAYCEVVPPEDADEQWSVCAQFILGLGNPSEPEINHFQQACHRFYKGETDWGFSRMIELKQLRNPSMNRPRAIIEDNTLIMSLYVRVIEDPTGVLWHNFIK